MRKPRVLVIAHNHPSLHPGGTEIFAYDLFQTLKKRGCEAMFLACTNQVYRDQKPGTNLQTLGRSSDEVILWAGHFDRFFQSQIDLHGIVPDLTGLLSAFRPEVVHVHHTVLLGVEMLYLIRRVCPDAKIVYTLHDYYPICVNDGQMVKTADNALCTKAEPYACHRCFPDRRPDEFVLRESHIKSMFGLVDMFLSPSEFLRGRYVEWGITPGKIAVMRNGRPATPAAPHRNVGDGGRRNAFAYFGNLNPFKGVSVALRAAAKLVEDGESFELAVHGGAPFQNEEFKKGLEDTFVSAKGRAIPYGAYRFEEMPRLIAAADWVVVPSIWWENAPLVIQEAFQHGRPVICSDIGGMAEAVTDGVDGLHFRAGDARDLARVMSREMSEEGLWERLTSSILTARTVDDATDDHLALYSSLVPSGVQEKCEKAA